MKSALITGANQGIGLETAKQPSKRGLVIYLDSRDIENGKGVVQELNANGFQNVKAIEIDVTKPGTILSAKNSIEKDQGKVDVLTNNADILGSMPQNSTDTTIDNLKEVYDTNVYGVLRVTQTYIDSLQKSPEPGIVNVTSSVGSLTLQSDTKWPVYDYMKWAAYASSKSDLNMYTINLAYEFRDMAFKINAVCPGHTKTDFTNHPGGTVEEAGMRVV